MKKVLGSMSRFAAAGFGLAILGLLMSLTYSALQRIFPDNFTNTLWGLVVFDVASMAWALTFVFQSRSVVQYASAGIGFIVGFLGTLIMVGAEVLLSGQDLAKVNTGEIGRWMVYTFIGSTALHALLVYVHHGASPDIHEQINVGIARGEIVTEAIRQATGELETEKAMLAETIHKTIVEQVKRDLNIPILADPRMPIIPRQYEQTAPTYGPEWKASTDITPTLDAYAWECQNCEGGNSPYTRKCQWCGKSRTNGSPVTAFSDKPPAKQEDANPAQAPFPVDGLRPAGSDGESEA